MAGNRTYQTDLPMFLTVAGKYSSPFTPQLVIPLLKSWQTFGNSYARIYKALSS
jgi:hypothetical protein